MKKELKILDGNIYYYFYLFLKYPTKLLKKYFKGLKIFFKNSKNVANFNNY